MKRILMFIVITLTLLSTTSCYVSVTEGTVQVQTIWSKITKVLHGGESLWTIWIIGDDYYEVSLRSETLATAVNASTKDNAALKITVNTTSHIIYNSDDDIINHLKKFGLSQAERDNRIVPILKSQVSTETRNAIAEYAAYDLLANQAQVQKDLLERLRPIFKAQLNQELESVQFSDRPDFIDDSIEKAASQVVANQKLKEASQAAYEAAKIDQEKKQLEAKTYSDPVLLQIRKLELQVEIGKAWAGHQGNLYLSGNSNPLAIIPEK